MTTGTPPRGTTKQAKHDANVRAAHTAWQVGVGVTVAQFVHEHDALAEIAGNFGLAGEIDTQIAVTVAVAWVAAKAKGYFVSKARPR